MFSCHIFLIVLKIVLTLPFCKEGENLCLECNPQKTLCIKCEKEVYIPDKNGGCIYNKKCRTGKNNCFECSKEGDLCKRCIDEYYPDENGGCSYSDNCVISEMGKCLKCKDGFILVGVDAYFIDGIKICKSLNLEELKNCYRIDYDDGSCLKCKDGYYLGNEDKKCSNIQNCDESINGICKKCNTNYYLNKMDNKCIEQNELFNYCKESIDGKTCDSCDIGYYFDDYGKCGKINYCANTSKEGNCLKCKKDYYLSNIGNSCTPEKHCLSGNKDFGICERCQDGYYLDINDRKCKNNQDNNNYKYCSKVKHECYECSYGYYLGDDHKCSTSYNCAESDNGICIKCKVGYHLGLDKKCNDIEHCIYSSLYNSCLECEDNYFYDRGNETCLIAGDNFKNCRAGYKDYYCQECKNEYYLNQTDHLCYSNIDNEEYYKCAIISSPGEKCLDCIEGYYIGEIDGKCSKIEGCAFSKNESWCLECDIDYCLNVKNGKCIYNNNLYNEEERYFYRCKKTNEEGTTCEICIDNYTLNGNGLCVDNIHCIERKEGICQKCLNEGNHTFCLNNQFGCVFTYDKGCSECNDILNFSNCTKCLNGYELDQDYFYNCVKKEE